MKALLLSLAAGLALVAVPAMAQPPPSDASLHEARDEELDLAVGENRTISAVDVKNYSEGSPDIADVKLTTDGSKFVVVGQKVGSTTLLLIKKSGAQVTWTINVHARPLDLVQQELQQLLEGMPGIHVRRVGGRFYLEGSVTTEAAAKRMQRIASLYPGEVESLVTVGTDAADEKLDVRIDFFFVQYDRTRSYTFGLNWPVSVGTGGGFSFAYDLVANTPQAQASIVNQPLPFLDLASTNGWVKILKQSTVVSSNGRQAEFASGGEQNYFVSAGLVSSIKSILFGTNISVLPTFDSRTREIVVKVSADVSDLAPPVSSTIPGRTTSKLDTTVNLKLGQAIVLSGLRTRTQRHATTGIPLLSEIPVLGVLFGSHNDVSEEVEGAILIVPSVLDSVPAATAELVNGAVRQYKAFHGDLSEVHAYDRTPPVVGHGRPGEP
jgi:pilus assembly protein CpaC